MDVAVDVLEKIVTNQKPFHVSTKRHRAFLKDEGENLVFLFARFCYLEPSFLPYLTNILDVLVTREDAINMQEPAMMLAVEVDEKEAKIIPEVEGYAEEFPKHVLTKPLQVATRVFVAEALAKWSFYIKDPERSTRIQDVVIVGLRRFRALQKQKRGLDITFIASMLTPKSEYLIYFVTHVVLVATMWGEREAMPGELVSDWHHVATALRSWVKEVEPFKFQNLEVWLELLFCLNLLHDKKFTEAYKEQTIALFPLTNRSTRDLHELYHTFVLWLFYLSSVDDVANEEDSETHVDLTFAGED